MRRGRSARLAERDFSRRPQRLPTRPFLGVATEMARCSSALTAVAAAAMISGCTTQVAAPLASPARLPEGAQTPTVVAAHVDPSTPETSRASAAPTEAADQGSARLRDGTWTGCMISRADLEAETNERATLAPPGGQILFLNWTDARPGHEKRLNLVVGLPSFPAAAQQVRFKGYATLQEQGELGTLETDTVDGKLSASGEVSRFDVTLIARDNLKPRLQADGTDRFSLEVRRVKRTDECGKATAG